MVIALLIGLLAAIVPTQAVTTGNRSRAPPKPAAPEINAAEKLLKIKIAYIIQELPTEMLFIYNITEKANFHYMNINPASKDINT